MSPAWLTPSPIPPLAMSPVDNFWRSPLTTVVVPERKLFELAEKPRPIPPTRPAKNACIVKLPSRLTTRSEASRVGKECVRTCRFRWETAHKKKNTINEQKENDNLVCNNT